MSTGWSLSVLLAGLHTEIEHRLSSARQMFGHSVAKGDASESVWLELLQKYLPERYKSTRAFVVDSRGVFSNQIDIVVYDRQYSPFLLNHEGQCVVPAESVYAVFEVKQSIDAAQVRYTQDKIASVRQLHRTSLEIPHAGGTFPPKPLTHILGGLLTFDSEWINPPLGDALISALLKEPGDARLDIGCVAAHGIFARNPDGTYAIHLGRRPATAFLFELIARIQEQATVPMIDVRAYAAWLSDDT